MGQATRRDIPDGPDHCLVDPAPRNVAILAMQLAPLQLKGPLLSQAYLRNTLRKRNGGRVAPHSRWTGLSAAPSFIGSHMAAIFGMGQFCYFFGRTQDDR